MANRSQHDNIVKYLGFVKSADCLNIILEYGCSGWFC